MKFQQGGASLPPLVSYQPVMVQGQQATESSGSTKSSKEDLTDKDLLTMLKEKTLPSDNQVIFSTLQNFYIDQQYGAINTSSIVSRYLQALSQMKIAQFNLAEYDDAFNIVKSNGGLNEYAINDRGQLFCVNKEGDFKLLSLDEIQDSGYQPLTNSDLLQYRAYSPDMAFKNNVLGVVKNGIGIETVTKMIQNVISNLGTTSKSQEGYASTEASRLLRTLEEFRDAQSKSGNYNSTVNNLYKSKVITKDQAQQAQYALSYIYSTLPENAKTLLKTKTKNGTDEEAITLVSTLVNSTLNFTSEFQLDVDTPEKESNKDSSDKLSLAESIQTDNGTPTKLPLVQGTSDLMISDAYMYPVTKRNGDPVGITKLNDLAKDSQITGLFDFSQVTFGDQLVEMGGINNIIADGSTIYKAYLPINLEQASKGIITPDLTRLAQLEIARNKVKETGARTVEEINNIYKELGLPPLYIKENEFSHYYRPFGILNGVALNDAFSNPASARMGTPMLQEITSKNDIQNYWNIIKGENSKQKFDSKGLLDFGKNATYQQFFKGLIFLPLKTTDRNFGILTSGEKLTEESAIQNQIDYQQEQRLKTFKKQGQL